MKRIRWTCLFFLVILVAGNAQPEAILEQANEAYRKNAYAEAVKGYQNLLAAGYDQAKVHYNLGNAYYRLDSLGPAILHYEKALLLAPGDADIRYNLALAREQLTDQLEVLPEFFLARWWRNTAIALSTTAWSILALLLLWGGMAGILVWLLAKERRYKKTGFVLGLVLLLLSLLPFFLASGRAKLDRESGYAVIMVPQAELLSAPESTSSLLQVHAGLKVKVLDHIGEWKKVSLPNGEEGWLPQAVLERI